MDAWMDGWLGGSIFRYSEKGALPLSRFFLCTNKRYFFLGGVRILELYFFHNAPIKAIGRWVMLHFLSMRASKSYLDYDHWNSERRMKAYPIEGYRKTIGWFNSAKIIAKKALGLAISRNGQLFLFFFGCKPGFFSPIKKKRLQGTKKANQKTSKRKRVNGKNGKTPLFFQTMIFFAFWKKRGCFRLSIFPRFLLLLTSFLFGALFFFAYCNLFFYWTKKNLVSSKRKNGESCSLHKMVLPIPFFSNPFCSAGLRQHLADFFRIFKNAWPENA